VHVSKKLDSWEGGKNVECRTLERKEKGEENWREKRREEKKSQKSKTS
jgi:hypothetical protein